MISSPRLVAAFSILSLAPRTRTPCSARRAGNANQNPLPTFGHFLIKHASEPYAGPTAPAGHAQRIIKWLGDGQPNSAIKAAELVWQLGHCSFPPLRLLLGSYAVESVRGRLRGIIEEIEDWKHLSFAPVEDSGAKDACDSHEKEIQGGKGSRR